MADEEFILDMSPESHQIIPDLSSVLKLDAKNPSAVFFLQAASLRQGKSLTVNVPGFRIVTEQPKIASCPFVLRLKGAEDFVCLCFKGNGANVYCYGLSVEDLLKWKPPEKGDESEESVLRLINMNNASLIGAVELANTETCDLKELVERILKYLPTFNKIQPKVPPAPGPSPSPSPNPIHCFSPSPSSSPSPTSPSPIHTFSLSISLSA